MANTQGLAVGLAVGIPSFLILLVVTFFWYRNQQKQLKEDMQDNEIDIGLKDDHSFSQFQEELHRKYEKDDFVNTRDERLTGDSSETSNDGQQLSTSTASRLTPNQQVSAIQKPQTSYDYYETMIPVLPSVHQQYSPSQQHDYKTHQAHDSTYELDDSQINPANQTMANSTTSLVNSHHRTSSTDLDNLAKQLNNPAFFEKLPSRAATTKYNIKPKYPASSSYNNSSSDLINNYLVGETHAINDHFDYVAPAVEEVPNK